MMIDGLATRWRNTKEMPFLLRTVCQGAMVVAPILLVLLVLPIMEWEIDGRQMSYPDLWSSGKGLAIASCLALIGFGSWGLAARSRFSRWLVVVSPLAPYAILMIFPGSSRIPPEVLGSAVVTAAVIYVGLFHVPSVRAYLAEKDGGA